jgi:ketosteroid isomerase-like protein
MLRAMITNSSALSVVRAYHDAWTSRDFAGAAALLDDRLVVEVPVNDYPTTDSFAQALAGFGAQVRSVALLSELAAGNEAMLLYDLVVDGLGELRVAEHFTVSDGRIARLRQIHDTAELRAAGFARPEHVARIAVGAVPERVWHALTTLDGLRCWWTPEVQGSPTPGAELHFGFSAVDEEIVMRVDHVWAPELVCWTCLRHTGCVAWAQSTVTFALRQGPEGSCELEVRHAGVDPELVAPGWDHFLASIAALAEHGVGAPFAA